VWGSLKKVWCELKLSVRKGKQSSIQVMVLHNELVSDLIVQCSDNLTGHESEQ
jgi:hypothetical protein